MTEGSKKKEYFSQQKGKTILILRTSKKITELSEQSIRMIESVNCCRINVRSIENAVKMYNAANKLGDY